MHPFGETVTSPLIMIRSHRLTATTYNNGSGHLTPPWTPSLGERSVPTFNTTIDDNHDQRCPTPIVFGEEINEATKETLCIELAHHPDVGLELRAAVGLDTVDVDFDTDDIVDQCSVTSWETDNSLSPVSDNPHDILNEDPFHLDLMTRQHTMTEPVPLLEDCHLIQHVSSQPRDSPSPTGIQPVFSSPHVQFFSCVGGGADSFSAGSKFTPLVLTLRSIPECSQTDHGGDRSLDDDVESTNKNLDYLNLAPAPWPTTPMSPEEMIEVVVDERVLKLSKKEFNRWEKRYGFRDNLPKYLKDALTIVRRRVMHKFKARENRLQKSKTPKVQKCPTSTAGKRAHSKRF
eukprot:m.82426 g.82426  ORF g.82426 m.82426 type:complete len:346 (-) comp11101_c0_seq1:1404-2441(-)